MKLSAPNEDEIEIHVFGRGFGEAILVHCGQGRWIAIDSTESESQTPWTLDYLSSISVNPDQIDALILTHWHTDHIRGAAATLDKARNATLILPGSGKLRNEFFARYGGASTTIASPASEMRLITEVIKKRMELTGRKNLLVATENCTHKSFMLFDGKIPVRLYSVSPSSSDIIAEDTYFRDAISCYDSKKIPYYPKDSENCASVVTLLRIGDIFLLFGADKESHHDVERGWVAALASKALLEPSATCCFFKVAHHGSQNAYCESLWPENVKENSPLVITPYSKNKMPLPRLDMIEKYKNHSSSIYICSRTRRSNTTSRLLRSFGGGTISQEYTIGPGSVRLRRNILKETPEWDVSLSGTAFRA